MAQTPSSGIEAKTAFDTSGIYMASGWAPSVDGTEVFLYSSGQPFSHGGYNVMPKTWGGNSGIRILRLRKDGRCERGGAAGSQTRAAAQLHDGRSRRSYWLPTAHHQIHPEGSREWLWEHASGKCDNGWRNVSCTSMKECHSVDPSPNATFGTKNQC